MNRELILPKEQLAAYCRAHGIRRLAVFGSALRDDFGPDSDIDLLVEFAPDSVPGILGIARMERELSALLGRKVDLRTPQDLSPYFRERVMDEAEVQYARGWRRPAAPHARRGAPCRAIRAGSHTRRSRP